MLNYKVNVLKGVKIFDEFLSKGGWVINHVLLFRKTNNKRQENRL